MVLQSSPVEDTAYSQGSEEQAEGRCVVGVLWIQVPPGSFVESASAHSFCSSPLQTLRLRSFKAQES